MKQKIDKIVQSLDEKLNEELSLNDLESLRVEYLGKQGLLTSQMSLIRTLPNEEKPKFGQLMNEAKQKVESKIHYYKNIALTRQMNAQLEKETIDVTLPGLNLKQGTLHPLTIVTQDLEDYFIGLGYQVAEGPELELDKYNFEMMNIAQDHPAREMHDSFYVTNHLLLRTHTSPIQARYMEKYADQPVAIIAPGKTYRRDPDDRTHSHQFMQCEGLVIDQGVTFAHLKDTLLGMARHIFGQERQIRLRPSYFPFTEPSVEVDVSYERPDGTTEWIEVLGAGMVHPNVLKMGGYDPKKVSGFAFGIGIERIAILKYKIDDIRQFYTNDLRFLNQFKGVL